MRMLRWETAALAGLLLVVLTAGGCGRRGSSGVIRGEVRFRGRPLPAGTITFVAADGRAKGGIVKDGLYQISGVPVGTAKVAVESLPPDPGILPSDRIPPKDFRIPGRYNDPEHSGLSWNVRRGEQTYDIKLDP